MSCATIANPAIKVERASGRLGSLARGRDRRRRLSRDRPHAARSCIPGVVVAPGLMIGATDSRHFDSVADNVYSSRRCAPRPEDLKRFHGTNERISTANYVELIQLLSPADCGNDRQPPTSFFPSKEPHHDQRRHRLHRPHAARQELEGRLQHDPRRDARRPRRQGRGRARRHRRRRGRRRDHGLRQRPRARPAATSRARSRCAPACRSRPAA